MQATTKLIIGITHMSVSAHYQSEEKTLTIQVEGDFNFKLVSDFRSVYKDMNNQSIKPVVDLRETKHIDSAALGMLINLRNYFGGDNAEVCILNCRPQIRKILTVARFDKLFEIK